MKLEKKDWELVKNEATQLLKQAEIMRVVNEKVLDTAVNMLLMIEDEEHSSSMCDAEGHMHT